MSYSLYARSRGLFDELCLLPRPSKQEDAVRQWLLSWAEGHGFQSHVDTLGNVMIRTTSHPHSDALVLQAHMDMVTLAAPDVEHDFTRDPIRTEERDGFLHARGTTLGADNGVGLCLALAAAECPDARPLELLCTVDEERGMSGALEWDFSFLCGKRLLNLDSEEENCLVLASAGGVRHEMVLDASKFLPTPEVCFAYVLRVSGGRGGHSGLDIDKNRMNANFVWSQMVLELPSLVGVTSVSGGTADNAIASECSGVFVTTESCDGDRLCHEWQSRLQQFSDDPDVQVSLTPISACESAFLLPRSVLESLVSLVPQGVVRWSQLIDGLVQTSNNYGILQVSDRGLSLTLLTRSSVESQREEVATRISQCAEQCGAVLHRGSAYPWWEASLSDPWVQTVGATLSAVFGTDPAIRAYHAGLECGALVDALGASAVSIGPDIFGAHTPQERVSLASWERVSAVVQRIVTQA